MSLSHNRCHLFLQDEAGCCAATLLLEKQIQVLEMESACDTLFPSCSVLEPLFLN